MVETRDNKKMVGGLDSETRTGRLYLVGKKMSQRETRRRQHISSSHDTATQLRMKHNNGMPLMSR